MSRLVDSGQTVPVRDAGAIPYSRDATVEQPFADASVDAGMPDATVVPADASIRCELNSLVHIEDDAGQLLESVVDVDCDGVGDICKHMEYDEAGQLVKLELDSNCDNVAEECTEFTYNAYGQELSVKTRATCNTPPLRCTWNTYGPWGQQLETVHSIGECEGAAAVCGHVRYGALGPNWPLSSFQDDGCDGTPDRGCVKRLFPSPYPELYSGMLTTIDQDCDGQPDARCILVKKDSQGRPTFLASDHDCDGTGDQVCITASYDASGKLKNRDQYPSCGSQPYLYEHRTFDANGHLLTEEVLSDSSQSRLKCTQHEYNSNGERTRSEYDTACDGIVDRCVTYRYEEEQRRVFTDEDLDCDDSPEHCSETLVDTVGRELLDKSTDCAGTITHCITRNYDSDGRLTRYTYGVDCGTAESTCSDYAYDNLDRIVSTSRGRCPAATTPCQTLQYDHPTGRSAYHTFDDDCDGVPETCLHEMWNPEGTRVLERYDRNCDHSWDSCIFYPGVYPQRSSANGISNVSCVPPTYP